VPRGLQEPLADAQVDVDKNRPDVEQEVRSPTAEQAP